LLELAELSELCDKRGAVRWIEGVLILELRYEQLQEHSFAGRRGAKTS